MSTTLSPALPLTASQLAVALKAAADAGAFATPVLEADCSVKEVAVYAAGRLVGTVFRPKGGGLAIWTERKPTRVASVAEAVRVILAPNPRKHLKKGHVKTMAWQPPIGDIGAPAASASTSA